MQNSDYVLMVQSGNSVTHSRLEKYLGSGDIMRKESLRHSSLPCDPFESDLFNEEAYRVESTGAIINLSSSIGLIYLFCSQLPADGYFKPNPRWVKETRTLLLPKSCPLQSVCVEGDKKFSKNLACLEACKKLHSLGALTDNLVPDIVIEEAEVEEFGNEPYNEEQPSYVPYELVNCFSNSGNTEYHCYLMELNPNFSNEVSDIVLAMRIELHPEIGCSQFEMGFDEDSMLIIKLRHLGTINLSPNEVLLCKRFQVTILKLLLDNNMDKLTTILDKISLEDDLEIDYLLLPTLNIKETTIVDWVSIQSATPSTIAYHNHIPNIRTKNGQVCTCILKISLVRTPHNGQLYITTDIMDLDGNSHLDMKDGGVTTYKKYFEQKHGIQLQFEQKKLLKARHIFQVKNYCHGRGKLKDKEVSSSSVELPPEVCHIVMSPLPLRTIFPSHLFRQSCIELSHCL